MTKATMFIAFSLTESKRRIFAGCARCQRILADGEWALCAEIETAQFLIGPQPKPQCCGETKHIPFLFKTPVAAQKKMDEVCEQISTHRNYKIFNYYGVESFIPKRVH